MKPIEESPQGVIYSASQKCRTSLSECLDVEELMQNEWAENRLGDFNLWASGIGASAPGRASLDARLSLRPDARDAVANLLDVLTGAVESCKTLVQDSAKSTNADSDEATTSDPEDPPRSFSPWSDDSESDLESDVILDDAESPLSKAKETVNSLLDLLVRIAITIRRSGTQSRLRKADRKFKIEDHDELRQHLIVVMLSQGPFSANYTFSFDQTDASKLTPIQWRLINCNLKRRNRFLYEQQHSKALNTPASPSMVTAKPEVQELPARPVGSKPAQKLPAESVAFATSASGITDLPAVLPTLPKGPVSSHATRTQLSNTVIKLPYPRPPKVDDDVAVFSCPCCCQTLPVDILETSRWKKHLAEDIQPYTCVLSGCSSPQVLYVTKKAWESHLRDEHGSADVWTCFACLDGLQFETEADFAAHTLQQHGETISEGQIRALSAACKTSITSEITSCPLCAWPRVEDGEVSQTALLDHVAEHVHTFSLRALPWAPDTVHETDAGNEKAATKVEPWLTKHNLIRETSTVIETLAQAPAPSPPGPHYFDTHYYFAEDSDNSSGSEVSDGTIERELREGSSPLFMDRDEEENVTEPATRLTDEEGNNVDAESVEHGKSLPDLARQSPEPDRQNKGQQIHDAPRESKPEPLGYVSRLSSWYSLQDTSREKRSKYKIGRTLGSGKNSVVHRAESKYGSVAIKIIDKSKVKDKLQQIYQEIELLQYVRHPNIVRFVDWFESEDENNQKENYYIVTDLAQGGDLFDRITGQGQLSETDAKRNIRDILALVEYLHYHGIVHRHLTVNKLGYLTRDESSRLILISLAHADWEATKKRRRISIDPYTSGPEHDPFGAFAPEIIQRQRSGKPADMWSIGIIAYMMLAGYSPFRSETLANLLQECTTGYIVFHERYWKGISTSAKSFIRRLLRPNPEDRLTIEEAKRHPWITGEAEMTQKRGRLVRSRWKCVVLKVQLALRIQQLRSEKSKGQQYPGGDLSYLGLPAREFGQFTESCREAFQAAVFTRMAVEEVNILGSLPKVGKPTM